MQLFLADKIIGYNLWLTDEDTKHCIRVLRYKPGDSIKVIDGYGNLFLVQILEVFPVVKGEILSTNSLWNVPKANTTLAVALLKHPDRYEWLIEKAVELGITEFQPLLTERTEKTGFKRERAERIIRSATLQCQRSDLMRISEPVSFLSWINEIPTNDSSKYMAWCKADALIKLPEDEQKALNPWIIIVGPEGDFTEKEALIAKSNGFQLIGLGARILRTETAAMYLASLRMQSMRDF
jgi:16S rRNA (uracil1498-N3)-methyltransferase